MLKYVNNKLHLNLLQGEICSMLGGTQVITTVIILASAPLCNNRTLPFRKHSFISNL